jgi:hypothetical protein
MKFLERNSTRILYIYFTKKHHAVLIFAKVKLISIQNCYDQLTPRCIFPRTRNSIETIFPIRHGELNNV